MKNVLLFFHSVGCVPNSKVVARDLVLLTGFLIGIIGLIDSLSQLVTTYYGKWWLIYWTVIATEQNSIYMGYFLLFLMFSFLIQATVNMVNDYFDFLIGKKRENGKKLIQLS